MEPTRPGSGSKALSYGFVYPGIEAGGSREAKLKVAMISYELASMDTLPQLFLCMFDFVRGPMACRSLYQAHFR